MSTPLTSLTVGPATLPLTLYRGDTLFLPLQLVDEAGTPLDLTNAEALMQVRAHPDKAVLFTFSSTSAVPTIVFPDADAGWLAISDTAANTQSYPWHTGVYDLQVTWADAVTKRTYLRGPITLLNDVSR